MELRIKIDKHRFSYIAIRIDNRKLYKLLHSVSLGRKQNFDEIHFQARVRVEDKISGKKYFRTAINQINFTKETGYNIGGHFLPKKRKIVIFPESIVEFVLLDHLLRRLKSSNMKTFRQFIIECRQALFKAIVEEIEHGYQDISQIHYLSITYRCLDIIRKVVTVCGVVVAAIMLKFNIFSYWFFAPTIEGLVYSC